MSRPSQANGQSRSVFDWTPFAFCCLMMIGLCMKGGGWGAIGSRSIHLPWFHLPAGGFILLWTATWLTALAMLATYPIGRSISNCRIIIFLMALACRLLLLPHPASDDINRYLWEGRLVTLGVSPYQYPPDHPALAAIAREDPYHRCINHPDLPAAYPPLAIDIFALISMIDYSPNAVKWVMVAADLGCLLFLYSLLARRFIDPRWAILYAFNPVTLYAFAGQGHLDALQMFFLMGALYLYDRKSWRLMFLFAGLAIQSKYVALATLPFFMRRENLAHLWILFGVVFLPYLPLLQSGGGNFFGSLVQFGNNYAFNSPLHGLLWAALGDMEPATRIIQIILPLLLCWGYLRLHPSRNPMFRNEPVSGCFFALAVVILLSPTVHVWYLSWVVPFLALRPKGSWIVLYFCAGAYFITLGLHLETGIWRLPVAARVVEWLPFALRLGTDIYRAVRQFHNFLPEAPPRSLSVVIPSRNEAANIKTCIDAVGQASEVCEIIVVDGGSTDNTADLARQAGARVVVHDVPPENGGGRGGQIRVGVDQAMGDVVAIVHADTLLQKKWIYQILGILSTQPMVMGGAVGGSFEARGIPFRCIDFLNHVRAAYGDIFFGDQVQFFRRRPIQRLKLYPGIPLMEDVELSLRLKNLGSQAYLFGNVQISARSWKTGSRHRIFLILYLFLSYLARRPFRKLDPVRFYRQYYRDANHG